MSGQESGALTDRHRKHYLMLEVPRQREAHKQVHPRKSILGISEAGRLTTQEGVSRPNDVWFAETWKVRRKEAKQPTSEQGINCRFSGFFGQQTWASPQQMPAMKVNHGLWTLITSHVPAWMGRWLARSSLTSCSSCSCSLDWLSSSVSAFLRVTSCATLKLSCDHKTLRQGPGTVCKGPNQLTTTKNGFRQPINRRQKLVVLKVL